jgi:hypothetical protein
MLEESEERVQALPHPSKYLLLVIAFLRHLLALHLEFVDESNGSSLLLVAVRPDGDNRACGIGRHRAAR